MADAFDVVVVGGGQAGAQAAIMLRLSGFAGTIAIVSDEIYPPYDRPPLSKEYFVGDKPFDAMLLQSAEGWRANAIALRLGRRVVGIAPAQKLVRLDDGGEIKFVKLIWAAGGAPRQLICPGADLAGVHYVRSRDDVDAIKTVLQRVTHVVVVGGGYIGLEIAAALVKLDRGVTLIEAMPRLLARVAGDEIANFIRAEHERHGVDIRLGRQVKRITGDLQASGVELDNGEIVEAELVIVGIGIRPAIGPLAEAGAEHDDGVRIDTFCRTSLEDVYAIGDCAEHQSAFADGEWIRIESVQNANDQAATAAKSICGAPQPYTATPWFWSNQYDLRLQTVGINRKYDTCVVRGDPSTRSFSSVYLKLGRVVALDCINNVRDYTHGRALVLARSTPAPERIADATVALKTLLAAQA